MKITRRTAAVCAAGVVVAGAAVGVSLAVTSGVSYAHPWCAGAFRYMYNSDSPTQTFQGYLNGLMYEQRQGAPLGQLVTDEQAASQDAANEASADNFQATGDIAASIIDLKAVGRDAGKINRDCGESSGWNSNRLLVPASS